MAAIDLDEELARRYKKLGICEEDLSESFIRGTGPGGQKINKTSSTVQIVHLPSGIEVRCQAGRSQSANRRQARIELCTRLEADRAAARLAERQEREKKRRQNRPRPHGLQEKILKTKRERSLVKKKRGRVRPDD